MEKIKVLMLGGRRCGKTTILANMCKNVREILNHNADEGPTLFTLNKEPKSIVKLNHALNCINALFLNHSCFEEFIIDDNQTREEGHIELKLTPTDHNDSLKFDFVDIPGEWCLSDPARVVEHLRQAQVVILAIDTPSMIEENGAYFEYCNKHKEVAEMVREALNDEFIQDERSQKLILMVPLKCEKYLIQNDGTVQPSNMNQICKKVKEHYSDLIAFLCDQNHCNKITLAITPIITISEVRWAEYALEQNGEYSSIYDENGYPIKLAPFDRLVSKFGFVDTLYEQAKKNERHTPHYCEQPLIYTVAFVLKYAEYLQAHRKKWVDIILNIPIIGAILGFLGNLWKGIINLFTSCASYSQEFERLRNKKMMRNNDGYEMLQNPLGI